MTAPRPRGLPALLAGDPRAGTHRALVRLRALALSRAGRREEAAEAGCRVPETVVSPAGRLASRGARSAGGQPKSTSLHRKYFWSMCEAFQTVTTTCLPV